MPALPAKEPILDKMKNTLKVRYEDGGLKRISTDTPIRSI